MDLKNFDKDYETLQKDIENKFRVKRLEFVQKRVLDVFSIDMDFIRDNLNKPFENPIIRNIYKEVAETQLGTAVLLIGFSGEKAQISEIGDNGIYNFRTIHFHTIGSGNVQAQNTLLFQKQSKEDDLPTTLYNVFKAKKMLK